MWENSRALIIKGTLKNKKMYKQNKMAKTGFRVNNSSTGETIEQKIERITNNKEQTGDAVTMIYQERGQGIDPACDPRTDRFDLALDVVEKSTQSQLAKRKQALEDAKGNKGEGKNDGKAESTQGQASAPEGSQTT